MPVEVEKGGQPQPEPPEEAQPAGKDVHLSPGEVAEGWGFAERSGQPPPHEAAEEVPNAWDIEAIAKSLKAEPIDEVFTPWPDLTEAVLFDLGNDQKTHLTLAPHRASEFERKRAHVHVEDVSLEFEPTAPPVTGE
jgi:hypothetical protein